MTDKETIVDGIQVRECGHYWNGTCHAYADNTGKYLLCINSPNCYYKQLQREKQNSQEARDTSIKEFNRAEELNILLKHKQQEYDRLKHDNDYEVGTLEKTIDNLTAENDALEKELRQKKMTILMNNDHYFEVDQTNKKIKQALQKIKEICYNNDELQGDFNLVDCDKYKLGKHNLAKKIIQKISEYEVLNDKM